MFDSKCYELAKAFIEDSGLADREDVMPLINDLAQEIQDHIEIFLAECPKGDHR